MLKRWLWKVAMGTAACRGSFRVKRTAVQSTPRGPNKNTLTYKHTQIKSYSHIWSNINNKVKQRPRDNQQSEKSEPERKKDAAQSPLCGQSPPQIKKLRTWLHSEQMMTWIKISYIWIALVKWETSERNVRIKHRFMSNIKTFETSWLQSSCSGCVSPFELRTTSSWYLTGNPFSPGSPFGPGAPCEEMLTEKLVWCSGSHQKKEHILSLIAALLVSVVCSAAGECSLY